MDGCGFLRIFSRKKRRILISSMTKSGDNNNNAHPHFSHEISDMPQKSDTDYQYHEGRRFHNREDVAYVMPDDVEEDDRIHGQHWIFKTLCGGNYFSPVQEELIKGTNVLDAGCGPGTWTMEMANDYPNSTIYGVDILTRFPESIKPGNCHFKSLNLSVPGHFPDNHFGFIHQRFVAAGLLAKDWEKVIQDHVRTLAPGGWLEAMEPKFGLTIQNALPKLKAAFTPVVSMLNAKGLYTTVDEDLEGMMTRAGLTNIRLEIVHLPLGEETRLGQLAWEDISQGMKAVVVLTKAIPELTDEEGADRFFEELRKECIDNRAVFTFCRFHGQKPTSTESVE